MKTNLMSYGFHNPLNRDIIIEEDEIIDEVKNMKKIKVEKSAKLEDGKYEGVIDSIEYREEPFEYVDVMVKVDDKTLKAGYPQKITEDSALGQLLERFGAKLDIGKEIIVDTFLPKGCKVSFMVVNEVNKKDNKTYSRIVLSSLKPL